MTSASRWTPDGAVAALRAGTGGHAAAVFAVADDRLVCAAAGGLPPEYAPRVEQVPVGPDAPFWGSAATGRTIVVLDPLADPLFAEHRDLATSAGIRSAMVVPAREEGRTVGLVSVYWPAAHEPTAGERELIEAVATMWGSLLGRRRVVDDPATDRVTGAASRAGLLERLDRAGRDDLHSGTGLSVLRLDLDGLRAVNDALGSAAGDALLRVVADRLRTVVRPEDTVARLGSDEFVVLCPGVATRAAGERVARRIGTALAAPLPLGDGQPGAGVTASIGIAIGSGEDPHALLNEAAAALSRAKAQGPGSAVFYDAGVRGELQRRQRLGHELPGALRRGEFELHYQPIVDVDAEALVELEALVRWRHPELGLLGPAEFLPLAEQSGFIEELGQWVLVDSCTTLARAAAPTVAVAVNVSPRQLGSGRLPGAVETALAASGLSAARLTLELTEAAVVADPADCARQLRDIRAAGVRVALDDFGTGWSSLSLLHAVPVDIVKIDRSFVVGLPGSPTSRGMVEGIARLAHALRAIACAEGVETPDQLGAVRAAGCERAQGYHLGRPAPFAQLDDGAAAAVGSWSR